ncbi:hypothetical protein ES705_41344 [subsurface metagenome]
MPEYRCQNCGAIWYGWGVKGICRECGGGLEPVSESAKIRKINEEKKVRR